MTRLVRLLAVVLLLGMPLACGSSGEECDTCSSDDDCTAGFVCSSFSDGSRRCASGLGETSCKVR